MDRRLNGPVFDRFRIRLCEMDGEYVAFPRQILRVIEDIIFDLIARSRFLKGEGSKAWKRSSALSTFS